MYVVGVTGYDRCGKDTMTNKLAEELTKLGHEVVIDSLARPLKKLVSSMFLMDQHLLEKMKNDNILVGFGTDIITTRDAIIRVATAFRELMGDGIFAKMLLDTYRDKDVILLIPDLRFKAEEAEIRQYPSTIIRLESDLKTCGKNMIRYEVDEIEHDFIITNKENNWQ
jgi:hypothetical protein